jgi:DNA-binding NarL/FixJ family response regulator
LLSNWISLGETRIRRHLKRVPGVFEAIRAAASGEALVSPSITVKLLRSLAPPRKRREPLAGLSARELDITRLCR